MEQTESLDSVFLALGSNLGDRMASFQRVLTTLSRYGLDIEQCSSVYETEPVGIRDQPAFLNLVSQARSSLSPFELLDLCKSVELEMGRRPAQVGGPRVIDIDILFFGQTVLESPKLVIPHPSLHLRRFVLVPLAELAPALKDPRSGRTVRELLDTCPDRSWVRNFGRVEVHTRSSL
jgi:2-amino-4-hydroxy-6-hydroxymethyldihydropteridine diphosphokinase